MNFKNKIIVYLMIIITILGVFSTAVFGGNAEDAEDAIAEILKGGADKIGNTLKLSGAELNTNKNLYCIQRKKAAGDDYKKYKVKSYIEIDGKEAKIYTSKTQEEPTVVMSDINAEVAYILGKKMGHGSSSANVSEGQYALWYVANSWMKTLYGEKVNTYITDAAYWGNDVTSKQDLNYDAEDYAEEVGDLKSSEIQEQADIVDMTDKKSIVITDVGDYYRVGPFKWQFDGDLESITVVGDNGEISGDNIRFIKYNGTIPVEVNVDEIASEDTFYVDVEYTSGATELKNLKLKVNEYEALTIYTAKIWLLDSISNDIQNFLLVDVGSREREAKEGEKDFEYSIALKKDVGFEKVDDRDTNIKLENVEFIFKATVYRYIDNEWKWVDRYLGKDLRWSEENINNAEKFYTDDNGKLEILEVSAERTKKDSIKAIETNNPHYGYNTNVEARVGSIEDNVKVPNHQEDVKISGYVWLEYEAEKMSLLNGLYDSETESGVNGIVVYLRDIEGNEISNTITSELGLYPEIDGGEYQFVDVDLDELEEGKYYVEFEYCGITYQSVSVRKEEVNGSKASDTTSRNVLDSKFEKINSTGTQTLDVNGVTINYNDIEKHVSTVSNHTGCNVSAKTNEVDANYDLYNDGFNPGEEEIRYVNLGLAKKAQADLALSQDLYNVRAEVNGFAHIYRYAGVRYSNDTIDEDSSWNLGVKFQNNKGTYNRAIYEADANYETEDSSKELKIYLTYKIAIRNESTYLSRINSLIDYSDSRYNLVSAGLQIDDNDKISDTLKVSEKQEYNEEYSKYIIDANIVINKGETEYLYVQFEMDREAILTVLNDGETLNNVAEINSYSVFKDEDINKSVSAIDQDSVPGNAIPGQVETYEDDTDAARSLKLELANERTIEGTVFVDSTGKDSNIVYSGEERLGNGIFDDGEATIGNVKVTLNDESGNVVRYYNNISKEWKDAITETDTNGNFTLAGFIPGNYIVTYTWGDNTYKVQYYKGTIYDSSRDQNNKYWYKVEQDIRKTDALDDLEIRKTIDREMERITKNTIEEEINKAYQGESETIKTVSMDSSSPIMTVGVEYDTVTTDGIGDQVVFSIKNVDFGIVERAKQQIELEKRVSGVKITLANGQTLIDAEIDEDGRITGVKEHLTYMGPSNLNGIETNGLVKIEMDSELVEGAKIETKYSIKAKNTSELDYTSDGYYYYGDKTNAQLIKVSAESVVDYLDSRLVAIEDTNWNEIDEIALKEYNITKGDSTGNYITSKLSKYIEYGETTDEVLFETSKLLTTSNDNYFSNKVEIVEVKKQSANITGTPVKITFSEDSYHFDIDNSEDITIVPSTGENKNYMLPTLIGISALLILGVGIITIKKFVLNDK